MDWVDENVSWMYDTWFLWMRIIWFILFWARVWDKEIFCLLINSFFVLKVWVLLVCRSKINVFPIVCRYVIEHLSFHIFCFADDSLLFSWATEREARVVQNIISTFSWTRGQSITSKKKKKSKIYFS